jgi:hypothetical protein
MKVDSPLVRQRNLLKLLSARRFGVSITEMVEETGVSPNPSAAIWKPLYSPDFRWKRSLPNAEKDCGASPSIRDSRVVELLIDGDCFLNILPGFVEGVPFRNTPRQRWDGDGESPFARRFTNGFQSHNGLRKAASNRATRCIKPLRLILQHWPSADSSMWSVIALSQQ